MRFLDTRLSRLLDDWSEAPEPKQRASGQNLSMDERLDGARSSAFEVFSRSSVDMESLRRAAIDYYRERVRVPQPETFTPLNAVAGLGPLSTEQKVVRLETLQEALDKTGVPFANLEAALAARDAMSRALLDSFISQWNERPDIPRNPLSFAAFKDQLLDEITSENWPDRLRDRLGLAHLDPAGGPIPVALMEYEVEDVINGTVGSPRFCAPTALDGTPYCQFVPTPRELPFGSPMALYPVQSDEDLVAEILHPRLTYLRGHMVKLGLITSRTASVDFVRLRNNHIWALRLATLREDFGVEL